MRRARAHRARISVLTLLAAATMLTPTEGPKAAGAPAAIVARPDLVVTNARLAVRPNGDVFMLGGQSRRLTWTHTTTNVRAGEVGGPSRRTSQTGIIRRVPGITVIFGRLPVPPLAAGGSTAGQGSFPFNIHPGSKYGTMRLMICADIEEAFEDAVTERNENNNCRNTNPLFVVPFGLSGTAGGTAARRRAPGVTLSWTGLVTFDLRHGAPQGNRGVFEYRLVEALVLYVVSGTNVWTGCTFSGSDLFSPPQVGGDANLTMAFARRATSKSVYSSTSTFGTEGWQFDATMTCPGESPVVVPINPGEFGADKWLNLGSIERTFQNPGLQRLTGRRTRLTRAVDVTHTWDLDARP